MSNVRHCVARNPACREQSTILPHNNAIFELRAKIFSELTVQPASYIFMSILNGNNFGLPHNTTFQYECSLNLVSLAGLGC